MSAAKATILAAACALVAVAAPGPLVVSAAVQAAKPAVHLAAAPAPPSDSEAMQDLSDAIAAPDKESYVGLVQTVEYGSSHSNASVYRIEHRAPVLTRRWYL